MVQAVLNLQIKTQTGYCSCESGGTKNKESKAHIYSALSTLDTDWGLAVYKTTTVITK